MNSITIKSSLEQTQKPEQPRGRSFQIARSLRMHRGLAISVTAFMCALFVAFGLSRHPQYEAHSLLYVQPITTKPVTDTTGGFYDPSRYDSYIQQQLQTIIRRDILSESLKKLPVGTWQWPGESEQSAVARLQSGLKAERVFGSYEISLSLKGDDPAAITKVVNEVTAAFLRKGREDELAQSDQQLQVLIEERERIQGELEKDRQEQAGLSSALGVADTAGESGNPYDVQLEELRKEVASARAAHAIAAAQPVSVSGSAQSPETLNAVVEEMIANDPGLTALKTTIMQRRSVLTSQMAGLTPINPLYKQDEEELTRLNQSLDNMTAELRSKAAKQLQGKLRFEYARTADIQERLERQLAQQTAIATAAAPKLQRASDIAADITRLQARFAEIDTAVRSIELQHSSAGLIHLSLAAVQPQKPQPSKKVPILIMALPLAFCLGTMAAVAMQMLDPKVYIAEDVGNVLEFRPMAVLPDPEDVNAKVMDEFMLRFVAGVDQAHRAGAARTYVFTAASADTEITEIVALLARKTDQIGYRTMVLKASAALQNLAPAEEEMTKSWGDTRLAKSWETRLTHVKRESFVVENLERLKQNVDLLFIEALPILSSAEAEFVARLADATILIAESAKTTRQELTGSLSLVRRLGVAGVAVVLNGVSLRNADDDFIAAVRSVEGRQSEVRRRDGSVREEAVVSVYEDSDLVSRDRKT